jgi:uncharacterized caspase-like protein
VIGNSLYAKATPLNNPVLDARAMAQRLARLGFDVAKHENADQKTLRRAIVEFGRRLQAGGTGLFYFAGHGMQVAGQNYLIPVDADIPAEDLVEVEGTSLADVLARMGSARTEVNIVILDACRDNPFARSSRSTRRGLAAIDAPAGTIIGYATAPGQVAADGNPGTHGLYTRELLDVMTVPGLKIEEVFKRTRQAVMQFSNRTQVPWESTSLRGDFYFIPPPGTPGATTPPAPAPGPPPAADASRPADPASPPPVASWMRPPAVPSMTTAPRQAAETLARDWFAALLRHDVDEMIRLAAVPFYLARVVQGSDELRSEYQQLVTSFGSRTRGLLETAGVEARTLAETRRPDFERNWDGVRVWATERVLHDIRLADEDLVVMVWWRDATGNSGYVPLFVRRIEGDLKVVGVSPTMSGRPARRR